MKSISFSKYIDRILYNITELQLPFANTFKFLSNKDDMKLQESMIAQDDVPYEKKKFDVYAIEERTIKKGYYMTMWIRIINPRFKCRRYIYPGDYIAELLFNPFGGWELKFHQDGCNELGDHKLRPAEHPHIQNGNGCFGGHKAAVDNALWSGNFFSAIKLIRKYLEEYNGRDTFVRGKYFDKQEGSLSLIPETIIPSWQRDELSDVQKKELKDLKPLHFKTYRVKRFFQISIQKTYYGESFHKAKDILNCFKFFNQMGRFEIPEEDKFSNSHGFPIEQTLELLSFFKTFNPNAINEKMNPLWTQFSEAVAVKSKMHIKYPDMATVYANGHDMINKNGGFFWNMRFKFDASYLKTLKVSVAWWGNNMTSNAHSRPSMTSTKWLTQNPKVFLNKVNKVLDDKNSYITSKEKGEKS